MANDNKKINDLVSESDDDTSELAVLAEGPLNEADIEFEADAATHAFDWVARERGIDTDSIAALRSELRDRDSNIEQLEYDLQQFRSRAKGLQKELEAREDLTRNIAAELEQQKGAIAEVREQLAARDRRIAEAEAEIRSRDARLTDLEAEVESERGRAESATTAYEDLEKRHTAGTQTIESLRHELAEEQARRKWSEDAEQALGNTVTALEERQRKANEVVASLRDYIDGRKSRWESQDTELVARERALREQQKDIERLTGDVRHSTERLDREKTEKELAQRRLSELETTAEELRAKVAELSANVVEREAEVGSLRSSEEELRRQLEQSSEALRKAEQSFGDARAEVERERTDMTSLRDELANAAGAAAAQQALLDERTAAAEDLEQRFANATSELAQERETRKEVEKLLESERVERRSLETKHESLSAEAETLRAELTRLRTTATTHAELQRTHSQLSGRAASQEATIHELREQLTKTEGYADTLRDKLQRQIADAEAHASRNEQLADNLTGASGRIDELTADLERERQQRSELREELQKVRREFDEEIRRIRFELDEAQETIAEGRNVNEQLTADLADSSGRRQTLEARLTETDTSYRSEVQALSEEATRLKAQLEDYEQKLTHKDAAVKALLAEFASKPGSRPRSATPRTDRAPGERDAEETVHRLPARKAAGDEGNAERDRVTRLLVGTIEGQKLRFPLFKDKLTIGRTAHNDIQIKAQYISRRHAVVVTEDEQTRIVDWGSKNGVYVNGSRVTEKVLRNGDIVTVGTAEFVFEERPKR